MTKSLVPGSTPAAVRGRRARWPQWSGYAAAVWSLLCGVLGVCWSFGVPGFPFGARDPAGVQTVFADAVSRAGAPIVAGLGLAGAALALAMARGRLPKMTRGPVLVSGWVVGLALALVVPDYRVLMMLAYAPICLLGAPFGWPPVDYLDHLDWPTVNLMLMTLGGLLWLLATVSYQRRSRQACGNCGREQHPAASWTAPAAASNWGRWAVVVAVTVPVLYDLTRWAWALGWPLGITREFWEEGQRQGVWLGGAVLGLLGLGGAILTHGLVRPWGEVFPRWLPGAAGKRVPVMVAVVPAMVVAVVVTSAGLMVVRQVVTQAVSMEMWATVGPMVLWPIWGVALAAAAFAYYLRRRGTCRHCGAGDR